MTSFPLGPHTLPTPRLTLRTPAADLLPALAAYWPGQASEAELASKIQKWDQTRAEGVNAWLVVVLNNDDDDARDEHISTGLSCPPLGNNNINIAPVWSYLPPLGEK